MKSIIYTDKAPEPIGPYSQAVLIGDMLFISGQIPIDPATSQLITGSIVTKPDRLWRILRLYC
jgi:2-iminobutanoate/2-iminopropanoate deaminase